MSSDDSSDDDDFKLREDDDDEENSYKIDQGVVEPTTAIPIPSIGNVDDYLLTLPSGVINLLMGEQTRGYHQPKIKCGQVRASLKRILPHWNKATPGNRRTSQLCAAVKVIIEYRTIAMWRCPRKIADDERFGYGTDTARPDVHAKEFKNKVIAKLIHDAWYGATNNRYRSLRSLKHFQCFKQFMLPLAEWMVLHMNPYGELRQHLIVATGPGTFKSSMIKKGQKWGFWEIERILNYDEQEEHNDNDAYNTKDACKGLPIEFALLLDRLYKDFFESVSAKLRHMVWIMPDKKKHSLWKNNRTSRFPRIEFTIPLNTTVPPVGQPATTSTTSTPDSSEDIKRLKKKLRTAKALLKTSRKEISNKQKLIDEGDEEMKQLDAQIEELKDALTKADDEVTDLKNALKKTQQDMDLLKTEVQTLQQQNESLRQQERKRRSNEIDGSNTENVDGAIDPNNITQTQTGSDGGDAPSIE